MVAMFNQLVLLMGSRFLNNSWLSIDEVATGSLTCILFLRLNLDFTIGHLDIIITICSFLDIYSAIGQVIALTLKDLLLLVCILVVLHILLIHGIAKRWWLVCPHVCFFSVVQQTVEVDSEVVLGSIDINRTFVLLLLTILTRSRSSQFRSFIQNKLGQSLKTFNFPVGSSVVLLMEFILR